VLANGADESFLQHACATWNEEQAISVAADSASVTWGERRLAIDSMPPRLAQTECLHHLAAHALGRSHRLRDRQPGRTAGRVSEVL
jgi:hypothetical protein